MSSADPLDYTMFFAAYKVDKALCETYNVDKSEKGGGLSWMTALGARQTKAFRDRDASRMRCFRK